MANNIHLKRYSVLDELKKALSEEKIKSSIYLEYETSNSLQKKWINKSISLKQ